MVKIENLEKAETKKIVDLDIDDSLIKAQVMIPEKWYQKLGDIAHEKGISRGALIREALRDWFAKIEKPTPENPEAVIGDIELQELIDSCSTFYGGFETMGEDGFFEKFAEKEWKFSDLTTEQFIKVCEHLKVGYKGFFSPPSIDEFIGYIEELDATKEQCELLTLYLEYLDYTMSFDKADMEKPIAQLVSELKESIAENEEESEEEPEE